MQPLEWKIRRLECNGIINFDGQIGYYVEEKGAFLSKGRLKS